MPLALAAYPGSGQNATLALTLIAKEEEEAAGMQQQLLHEIEELRIQRKIWALA